MWQESWVSGSGWLKLMEDVCGRVMGEDSDDGGQVEDTGGGGVKNRREVSVEIA